MYHIAIVEDSPEESKRLEGCVARYAEETGTDMRATVFSRAAPFLSKYNSQFDVVFLDIQLPDMNGIEIAKRVREKDSTVVIIFVTHLAQYAIRGYEVNAMDYVIKPMEYSAFRLKMQRAIIRCQREAQSYITFSNNNHYVRLKASELKYVEIFRHSILYHTCFGDYTAYGTSSKVEAELPKHGFFRCGSSFIINLRYVDRINGSEVVIGDVQIPISRTRRKELISAYHAFYGDLDGDSG